jgi:hypothetical protein
MMAPRRRIATWLFRASKLLTLAAFVIVLLAALGTHWGLAILWLIVGLPISFLVVGLVTTPVTRVLVGGWQRDQEAIAAWLATIPRPQRPR